MSVVLNTIVPVFAVVAVGFLLAGRRPLDLATLSDTALLVTAPALLFSLLAGSPLEPTRFLTMAGGALFVVAGTAGLAALYSRSSGADLRGRGCRCLAQPDGSLRERGVLGQGSLSILRDRLPCAGRRAGWKGRRHRW